MHRMIRGMLLLGALGSIGIAGARAEEKATVALKTTSDLNKITGSDAMQGALKLLLDDKSQASKLIDEGLRLKEKESLSYNAALILALAAADTKDLKKSEALLRVCMHKAAKLQSEDKLYQSYTALVRLYYSNKKYADSARICQELLELKTDDGKPRMVLKAEPTQLGDHDFKEHEMFDPVERIRPKIREMLIQSLAKQGKYEQALKMAENPAQGQGAASWTDRELKAWVLREAGKYEEAAKVYEEVIKLVGKEKKLEPEEKELILEETRYLLSNAYLEMGKIDKASEQLEHLLAAKPDNPGYNNDLGYIWADHGMKLDEAEKLIKKALDLDRKRRQANPDYDPDQDQPNGAYLDSLGWVYFKKGNYKEAKKALLDAVKDKASQHIEIFDHLGDTYMALGEKTEALAAWQKGLEHVTDNRRDQERKAIVEKKIETHK